MAEEKVGQVFTAFGMIPIVGPAGSPSSALGTKLALPPEQHGDPGSLSMLKARRMMLVHLLEEINSQDWVPTRTEARTGSTRPGAI